MPNITTVNLSVAPTTEKTTLKPGIAAVSYNWKTNAKRATDDVLPDCTYSNGTGGVGATLTATNTGRLSVDGHLVDTSERIVVKDQASALENGIYVVTNRGFDGRGGAFILTRATDADQTAEMNLAALYVEVGDTNAGHVFSQTTVDPDMGVDDIVWVDGIPSDAGSYLYLGGVGSAGVRITATEEGPLDPFEIRDAADTNTLMKVSPEGHLFVTAQSEPYSCISTSGRDIVDTILRDFLYVKGPVFSNMHYNADIPSSSNPLSLGFYSGHGGSDFGQASPATPWALTYMSQDRNPSAPENAKSIINNEARTVAGVSGPYVYSKGRMSAYTTGTASAGTGSLYLDLFAEVESSKEQGLKLLMDARQDQIAGSIGTGDLRYWGKSTGSDSLNYSSTVLGVGLMPTGSPGQYDRHSINVSSATSNTVGVSVHDIFKAQAGYGSLVEDYMIFNSNATLTLGRKTLATTPLLVLKGASAQTANLQEWQDSSSVVKSFVTKNGLIVAGPQDAYNLAAAAWITDSSPALVSVDGSYAQLFVGSRRLTDFAEGKFYGEFRSYGTSNADNRGLSQLEMTAETNGTFTDMAIELNASNVTDRAKTSFELSSRLSSPHPSRDGYFSVTLDSVAATSETDAEIYISNEGTGVVDLWPTISDSTGSIAFTFSTSKALTATDTRIASFQENGYEVFGLTSSGIMTSHAVGAECAPDVDSTNWTVGAGWTALGTSLNKSSDGTGTAAWTSGGTAIQANKIYRISFYVIWTSGSATYTLGGTTGNLTIDHSGQYTDYVSTTNTDQFIITPTNTSRFYITNGSPDVSIKQQSGYSEIFTTYLKSPSLKLYTPTGTVTLNPNTSTETYTLTLPAVGTSGSSTFLTNDGTGGLSWTGAGTSGTSGTDGTSGTSGTSGTEGTSGTSGTEGTSGTSGTEGTSGTSGTEGTSGTSGSDGTSGTSGPAVSSGAGAPGSTPGAIGDIYVDTSGAKVYIATGTGSSGDWAILN